MTGAMHPHPFACPDSALDDLRERLAHPLARAGNRGRLESGRASVGDPA